LPYFAAFLSLILVSGQLQAESDLTALEITKRPSWEPSISDSGEIAYLAFDTEGFPNAFSTCEGQITVSKSGLLRFPHLGESGEVVYADRIENSPLFQVWSSALGQITSEGGNLPSISGRGEVCFVRYEASAVIVESNLRGTLATGEIPTSTSCDINRLGEVVYRGTDSEGRFQIFSTTRGQLTKGQHGLLGTPAINDSGEVVYVESGELFSLTRGQITSSGGGVGFFIDINDRGDIVVPLMRRDSYRIVLLTRSPDRYSGFKTLDRDILHLGPRLDVEIAIAPSRADLVLPRVKRGMVPVVLFTTSSDQGEAVDFDASKVDELTVRFGPSEATIVVRSMADRKDVDGDGDIDLLLWFRVQPTGLKCNATSGSLSGKTTEGQGFSGTAEIGQPVC
jgi:hypothetical protein